MFAGFTERRRLGSTLADWLLMGHDTFTAVVGLATKIFGLDKILTTRGDIAQNASVWSSKHMAGNVSVVPNWILDF
jgi:hypothetical protein